MTLRDNIRISETEPSEDGTHDELMRSDKIYATMYRAQASWYDPD